jgi:hypothetical protein
MSYGEIRDVWASSVDEEFAHLRTMLHAFPYIAMVRLACWLAARFLDLLRLFRFVFWMFASLRTRSSAIVCSHCYDATVQDTEFPGIVAKPTGEFKNQNDFQFQMLKCNVDVLRLIQLGISVLPA